MRKKDHGKLRSLVQQPTETITFMFSVGLLFFACYLLSPWYETVYSSVITALAQDRQESTVGAVMLVVSLPGLVFPWLSDGARTKMLKFSNFAMFLVFLFLTVLRVISTGFVPMHWLPLLMLASVCMIHRLYLDATRE